MNNQEYIDHLEQSIKKADNLQSKITEDICKLPGFSSDKVRHILNNIVQMPDARYLEIGTWKGSTLVSALYQNQDYVTFATAIDNFSEFENPEKDLLNNIDTFLPEIKPKFTFLQGDCWELSKKIEGKYNIYLYDGGHQEEEQYKAFVEFDHLLDDTFIAIVDDFNWGPTQKGTRRAFANLNYKILSEHHLPARYNGDRDQWWHGLYVAVIQK